MSYLKVTIKNVTLLFMLFSSLSLVHAKNTHAAQSDEQKKLLRTEFFGDFSKAKKIKNTGKITLAIWEPYVQHMKNIPFMAAHLNQATINLTIDCDEIWETRYIYGLSKQEIKHEWNKLDISRLYWKDGKVQASVVLKQFISSPITNVNLPKREHKITSIYSRSQIFKELQ